MGQSLALGECGAGALTCGIRTLAAQGYLFLSARLQICNPADSRSKAPCNICSVRVIADGNRTGNGNDDNGCRSR
jgi:hypothetical protein